MWNKGNKVVLAGSPIVEEMKMGSNATQSDMVPGRLVVRDTSDESVKEAPANTTQPAGWIGYEQSHPAHRPSDRTTAYSSGAYIPVLRGPGVVLISEITSSSITKGDLLVSAGNGKLTKATFDATTNSLQYVAVAIALETVDASTVDKECVVMSLI
jgi:hypothetical protein